MKRILYIPLLFTIFLSCQGEKEHTAAAIYDKDSVSMMTSFGVNTLISDSGIMKYKIVAEEWEVNTVRHPSRWIFHKGLFMEQFDEKFQIQAFVQCDTAYYFDQNRLWELRGRVRIRTADGLRFASEELFWDQVSHEFYSHMFSKVITPERTMQGTYFRSNENMTRYMVTNSKGSFESADMGIGVEEAPATQGDAPADTAQQPKRTQTVPTKRTMAQQP